MVVWASRNFFGPFEFIIGRVGLQGGQEPLTAVLWSNVIISRFLGGEIVKIPNVKLRKILIFEDFFVNTALILALRQLKTDRKQQELKEANLNFSKLFSDPKNIKFQEKYKCFCMDRGDFFLLVRILDLH